MTAVGTLLAAGIALDLLGIALVAAPTGGRPDAVEVSEAVDAATPR